MSRKLSVPFVVTVASALAACGGSTASDGGTGGSGNTGGSGAVSGSGGSGNSGGSGAVSGSGGTGGNSPQCPASFPTNGDSCKGASGMICNYDQGTCCPAWQASCIDDKWQAYASSCNPPPPDPCPYDPPVAGSACGSSDPCASPYQYCTYAKCSDGSPHVVAQCDGGTWSVSTANCTLPPCDGLDACECFDRSDCQALTDTCLCECDYQCPGKEPCDCACGGGAFLGCAAVQK
ncbi:MAG: hypothetical protein KC776_16920 [Myxococcales bacterium]|nr:hypothetical protein [Myxococcales bacterium]